MSAVAPLDELIGELEQTAARLRFEELDPAQAAALVDRCAELAVALGAGLDRAGREPDLPAEGQEQLL
jgi:hypothetical protein